MEVEIEKEGLSITTKFGKVHIFPNDVVITPAIGQYAMTIAEHRPTLMRVHVVKKK